MNAGDQRSDQTGQQPSARHHGPDPGPHVVGEDPADHDVETDADEAAAEALDAATHQEHLHGRREAGDHKPANEDPHSGEQDLDRVLGDRSSGPAIVIVITAIAVGAANASAYRLSPSRSWRRPA